MVRLFERAGDREADFVCSHPAKVDLERRVVEGFVP